MVRVMFGFGLALAIACGGRSVRTPEEDAAGGTGTGGASIGTGGASIGTGGSSVGTGGALTGQGGVSTGGAPTTAVCDPDVGELNSTPFPNCSARVLEPCDLCLEANCCEELRFCYGSDPGNVCGSGGPRTGAYAGYNEVNCFIVCARDYVRENDVFDDGAVDTCSTACTTEACGLIGNATQDLLVCLMDNCEADCFVP